MATATKNMNANQLIDALIRAELRLGPGDTQYMIRKERMSLQVTLSHKNSAPKHIADAIAEAKRVAEMWGVEL